MPSPKKPTQDVTIYGMSIHFGICAGPVDYMSGLIIDEKDAWDPTWHQTVAGMISQPLFLPELFGGETKEGGLGGMTTWLPGHDDQVMPEVLAAKFGRTSATMPAYRGISSLFFWGVPVASDNRSPFDGFYWRANTPYLPGVWVTVARASTELNDAYARIYRGAGGTRADLIDMSIDAGGVFGTGNRGNKWDTNGDWFLGGHEDFGGTAGLSVFHLPDGESHQITIQAREAAVHLNSFGELITIADSGTSMRVTDPASGTLLTSLGLGIDLGGAIADDITIGSTNYMLLARATFPPAQYFQLIQRETDGTFSLAYTAAVTNDTVHSLSMGRIYAYCLRSDDSTGWATDHGTQILRVEWAGTSPSETIVSPSGLTGNIAVCHYDDHTNRVIVICENGDIFQYSADLSTLIHSNTSVSMTVQFNPLLSKRLKTSPETFTVPDDVSSTAHNTMHVFSATSLALVETIPRTGYPNEGTGFAFIGMNEAHGGSFMAGHFQPSAFWFLLLRGPFDSNPAHIIYDALTNTDWGMGAPESAIDFGSFTAAGIRLYNEKFGLSMIWTQQAAIEDFLSEVIDHIEATLFVNPRTGLLTLKLIRFDYSIPSLPVFTPDNSVVTNFSRKLWGETINEIIVTWTNPLNEENETVVAQDLANIEAQGGIVSDGRNYYGVRRKGLAMTLAQRDLRSASTPLAKCDIEINRAAWDLLPGECCKLDSPDDGIDMIVMRVGPVDYGKPGDSTVRVSLMEDVFALSVADYEEPPETEWVDTSETPSPADFTKIITLPYYTVVNEIDAAITAGVAWPQVFAGVLVGEAGQDSDTFKLYGEETDATGAIAFASLGTMTIASHATLPAALDAEVETLVAAFPDRTQGNSPVVGGLMLIDGGSEAASELCLVVDFGASGWTFKRGVLDTVPRAWPLATPVWFIDGSMIFADATIRADGETVDYKVLPSTSLGTLALAAAPVVSETLTGRPWLPLRPADVKANGDDGFAGVVDITGIDPIPVTWARRNREAETAIIKAWTDGDVTPEAGQTTIIEVLDPAGTSVVTTHAGLTGTSFNVPAASFGGNTSGWIRVGAERDGHRELQGYAIECVIPTPISVAVTGVSATGSVGSVTVPTTGDPYISSVVLLIGADGTDGSTAFVDESPVHRTLTAAGNAQIDTAQSKFGGSSALFDGTGDYVSAADSNDWFLNSSNTSPWTVECWIRQSSLAGDQIIMAQTTGVPDVGDYFKTFGTGADVEYRIAKGSSWGATLNTTGGGMVAGVWYHICAEKNGSGKMRIYIDGVMKASSTPADSIGANVNAPLSIGGTAIPIGVLFNGWLDEFRITKGVARYDSDSGFTVPIAAFPRS